MKKIGTILSCVFFCLGLSLQTVHAQQAAVEINPNGYRNPLWLGFNMGGAWQTSNVAVDHAGLGAGFTIGQNYKTYTASPLFFGWRFRFLNAETFGQDSKRNYGIKNNQALNGSVDTTLNYAKNGGFVYNNFKMTLNEMSLEVLAGPNLIHKKNGSGPLAYVFGGVGMVQTQTMLDMKDANGNAYNFKGIDTANVMNKTQVLNALSTKQDHSYETAADGSATPTWHFMPSLGVGLGYQFHNTFQIGMEYKVTFAGNTPIDGIQWDNNNNALTAHNKYNYLGGFIKLGIGGKPHHESTGHVVKDDHITTPPPPPPPPSGVRPSIYLTYPNANPYTVSRSEGQLTAHILYVPYANDIRVTVNGTLVNTWHYNSSDGVLNGDFSLLEGNNIVTITATNAYGTDSKSQYFEYTVIHTNPGEQPPFITITSPVQNPFLTSANLVAVTAIVNNVYSSSEVQLKINGIGTSNFQFDPSSHVMNFVTGLGSGNNFIYISATNTGGTDSKSLMVNYTPVVVTNIHPPVVQFVSPGNTPFLTSVQNGQIMATVQNVTDPAQIQFMVNGQRHTDFTFAANTGMLTYNSSLFSGNNYFYLRATNEAGTDSKSIDVIYSAPVVSPPLVTIHTPYNNPYNTSSPSVLVRASVDNINFPNQIEITENGSPMQAFTYSVATRVLEFTAPLAIGSNAFVIRATNSGGSDSKSLTVMYSAPPVPRPVVTILSPIGNPYSTQANSISVNAVVDNVSSASQIGVTVNGVSYPNFSYFPGNRSVQFNFNLNTGENTFYITATNNGGYDSKTGIVLYNPIAAAKPEIQFISPAASPSMSNTSPLPVTARVINVHAPSQIQVLVNGINLSNFNYSLASQILTFNAPLNLGKNTLTVTAANNAGATTESVEVNHVNTVNGGGGIGKPVITITLPVASPYTTNLPSSTVDATITNIFSKNDIHVQINGGNFTNFNFNPSNSTLTLLTPLNPGSNYVLISASNVSGMDNKTTNLIYTPPVIPKPVVTFTNPGTNPFSTSVNRINLTAQLQHVSSANEIQFTVNGVSSTGFNFNPGNGIFTFVTNLVSGKNTFTINAANAGGTATGSQDVNYVPLVLGPKPVVTFTTPNLNPFPTSTLPFTCTVKVQNVVSADNIVVSINGTSFGSFNYNPSTQDLTFNTNLNAGPNTVTVSASNAVGSDSKTITVGYTPPRPMPKPAVSITTPFENPFMTTEQNVLITASVMFVSGSSSITVTCNSAPVSFVYDPNSHEIHINDGLVLGLNSFVITATNGSGSDSKTEKVIYSSPTTNNGGGGRQGYYFTSCNYRVKPYWFTGNGFSSKSSGHISDNRWNKSV